MGGLFLSFISFTFYICVISPDDGWDCQLKHFACVRNKWMSRHLCSCIGRITMEDIKGITKDKLKFSLHNPWKQRSAVEVHLHTFLATVLDEGKWSSLNPGHFTLSERASDIYWMVEMGWLGPSAGRNVSEKRKKNLATVRFRAANCPSKP